MKGHKIRLLAILLLFGILLCGCNVSNYIYTEDSLKKVAEKSLKKKYGEEFVVHSAWARDQERFFADCSPKNNSEVVFKATFYKNGKGLYDDGYARAIVSKEANELLEPNFQVVFNNCYTRTLIGDYYSQPEVENVHKITLQEYLEKYMAELHVDGYITCNVYIENDIFTENDLEVEYQFLKYILVDKIKSNISPDFASNIKVNLYFLDSQMLKKTKEDFGTYTSIRGEFDREMQNYQEIICIYKDGKIEMDYSEYREQRLLYKEYEELRNKKEAE